MAGRGLEFRVLQLLDGAERAGIAPMSLLAFHGYVYLSNVLSPVWEFDPPDGKVLKRRGGPFYPDVQDALDTLVVRGLIEVSNLTYAEDGAGRWRLEASYATCMTDDCRQVFEAMYVFRDEVVKARYLRELAFGIADIGVPEFEKAVQEDLVYSEPGYGPGAVIDFAEWKRRNRSAAAATALGSVRENLKLTPGEKVTIYVRFLERELEAADNVAG